MVLFVVAFLAQQFEVLMIQRHSRIVDVLRCQVNLVMHNLPRPATPLAETVFGNKISVTATPPRFGLVKVSRPWFHVLTPQSTRTPPRTDPGSAEERAAPKLPARRLDEKSPGRSGRAPEICFSDGISLS